MPEGEVPALFRCCVSVADMVPVRVDLGGTDSPYRSEVEGILVPDPPVAAPQDEPEAEEGKHVEEGRLGDV